MLNNLYDIHKGTHHFFSHSKRKVLILSPVKLVKKLKHPFKTDPCVKSLFLEKYFKISLWSFHKKIWQILSKSSVVIQCYYRWYFFQFCLHVNNTWEKCALYAFSQLLSLFRSRASFHTRLSSRTNSCWLTTSRGNLASVVWLKLARSQHPHHGSLFLIFLREKCSTTQKNCCWNLCFCCCRGSTTCFGWKRSREKDKSKVRKIPT